MAKNLSTADAPGADSSVELVPLGSIKRDQRVNTRPVDQSWVDRRLAEGFDQKAFGVPVVSARPNGTYVWLDGQNRGALAAAAGFGRDSKVTVVVHRGLTRDQEASIFLGLNDGRTVAPIYKFLARVASKDEIAVAVSSILRNYGWRVWMDTADGNCQCVGALEWAYRLDGTGEFLARTVSVITAAWANRSQSMRAVTFKGIAQVVYRYGSEVDPVQLTERLAEYKGGPLGLYADARGLHGFRGGSVPNAVSEVVVNAYNKRRRSGRVEEWGN